MVTIKEYLEHHQNTLIKIVVNNDNCNNNCFSRIAKGKEHLNKMLPVNSWILKQEITGAGDNQKYQNGKLINYVIIGVKP